MMKIPAEIPEIREALYALDGFLAQTEDVASITDVQCQELLRPDGGISVPLAIAAVIVHKESVGGGLKTGQRRVEHILSGGGHRVSGSVNLRTGLVEVSDLSRLLMIGTDFREAKFFLDIPDFDQAQRMTTLTKRRQYYPGYVDTPKANTQGFLSITRAMMGRFVSLAR